ncbi:hypothetical protein CBS63078_5647 [Aspergillus niger]|nr:hypothetical protein CBS13152_3567 [Aspergillus niger]KAI2904433.1 hypothetical protein CBS63078_5647 [Aspergillus niger]KAI3026335.1 hypothetical protein CBS147347_4992 [Aspergillus niger]KAI3034958.1 hypothetical protein CBS76997_10875 [Aspergillus niger]
MSGVQELKAAVGTHKRTQGKGLEENPIAKGPKVLDADRTSMAIATPRNGTSVCFVDTHEGIHELIEALIQSPVAPPSIYVDLEGASLGKDGEISILQIYITPRDKVFLADIHILGATAFNQATSAGTTLRSILESAMIPKVFFDFRNDSAAMFHQYQVELAGIYDLQVMKVGTRARPGKYLAGLAKCISRDAPMTPFEKASWRATKERGKILFSPQHGGSSDVFNARPLSKEVVEY